jgi:glyoxylase-like metal-dependent hydrolase (beta-lactamase superfamily II)
MSTPMKITDHVWWLPPAPPDRPSLCAVAGQRRTLLLDAGSSAAHTRGFVDALSAAGVRRPDAVALTHADWDHVLGAAELGAIVIAHALTAEGLAELAARDWSDEGLDDGVAAGRWSARYAADVKAELPSPRAVEIAPADVVFHQAIEIALGGVTAAVRHVGGDHSADSCVVSIEPDGVLFLGDCLSASPGGVMTSASAARLREVILGSSAQHYVEGHHESVSSRAEIEELFEKLDRAERAALEGANLPDADEDTAYFLEAFRAGRAE